MSLLVTLFSGMLGFRFSWMYILGSKWVQSGPCVSRHGFCYPASWFVLSCVTLSSSFIALLGGAKMLPNCIENLLLKTSSRNDHRKLRIKNKTNNLTSTPCNNLSHHLKNLALVSALSILNDLPTLHDKHDLALHNVLKAHCNHMGFVQPSLLRNSPVIESPKCHLDQADDVCDEVLKGSFQFVVDTGCTTTTTPHREDFENFVKLDKPVTLQGIAGDQEVTHGGVIKFDCINSTGDVVTI